MVSSPIIRGSPIVMGIGLNTSSRDGNISRSDAHAERAGSTQASAVARCITAGMVVIRALGIAFEDKASIMS
jgi:hypothetical protein